MRVLIIATAPDLPEAHLVLGLIARGVHITWMGGGIDSPQAQPLRAAGVQMIPASLTSRFSLRIIRQIRALLHQGNFDLVHVFSSRAISNAVLASIGFKVPILAYRGTMARISRLDPTGWVTYYNPKVKKIICVCEAVRQALIRDGIAPDKAVTIYKGHDCSWYRFPSRDYTEFGVPPEAPVLSCVANSRPNKGVPWLLEVFAQLSTPRKPHLLLIGAMDDCKPLVAALPSEVRSRVHLLGKRPDAVRLLASVVAQVVPSRGRDGLPKTALEALAQGVPVIGTVVGGIPEVVIDGKTGIVVPDGDGEALANAMVQLVEDQQLRQRMSEQARASISGVFSIHSTIEQTFEMYRSLVDGEGHNLE